MRINNARRYRAIKARNAYAGGAIPIAVVFKTKHTLTEGFPLPTSFPNYDLLVADLPIPYTTYEDLHGAEVEELIKINGITPADAREIIAATEAWFA